METTLASVRAPGESIQMFDIQEQTAIEPRRKNCVSFHDIHYDVTACSCIRKKKKKILRGLSGYLPEGLNAIMGPTGSGKTRFVVISYLYY